MFLGGALGFLGEALFSHGGTLLFLGGPPVFHQRIFYACLVDA